MTTATGARSSTAGDGTTTQFTATFRANSEAEIGVAVITDSSGAVVQKTLTTHYTVSLNSDSGVPTITMLTAPIVGETLIIYPANTVKQEDDLDPSANLYGSTIEAAVDKLAAQLQALEDKLGQCVRYSQADGALAALGDGNTRGSSVLTFVNGVLTLEPRTNFQDA